MLKKGQLPIMITSSLILAFFLVYFIATKNSEFIVYTIIVLLLAWLVIGTMKNLQLPNIVLWGLLAWATMHLAGGAFSFFGTRLYDTIFIAIVGEPYNILRYDQLIHIFGFGVATLTVYFLIKPKLKPNHKWVALSIVLVMAGTGLGALNEILEFMTTVISPVTGVGGYINNSVDLVSNLIGAVIAMVGIYFYERKKKN